MLDLFKKILRENSTVRETEELARAAKGEIQKREPRTPHERLWIPELDEMAKNMEEKHGLSKVSIFQSRSLARIVFIIRGEVETTTSKIEALNKVLMGSGATTIQ